MKTVNKLIENGHVKDLKELLTFIVIDRGAVHETLKDMRIDDVCPHELEEELYKYIQTLKLRS